MLLNLRDINSIRRLLPPDGPATDSFVVIDLRGSELKLHHVFMRSWAPSGVVWRTGDFVPEQIKDWLPQVGGIRPIVMIGGETLNPSLAWIWELASQPWFIRPNWPGDDQDASSVGPESHIAPVPFVVEGLASVALTTEKLPIRLTVRLGANSFRNIISVKPRNGQSGLPDKQWFHLAAPLGSALDRHLVGIDIEPQHDGDVWALTSDQIQVKEVTLQMQVTPEGLDSVTVVFDRTCPQGGKWSAAKSLVLKQVQEKVGGDKNQWGATIPETGGRRDHPRDYNQVIRDGVAIELKDYIGTVSPQCSVNAIWFADDPADLSWPVGSGLSRPTAVGEWRAEIPLDELGDHFTQYTYTLGLDIWDALDLAVADVARYLEHERRHKSGVIIIGNSPPPPPLDKQSAYWRILRADPSRSVEQLNGATCTNTSRRPSRFTDDIQKLAKLGIPCVYVFLEHNVHENPDDESAFAFFRKIQQLVFEALSESLPVFKSPASQNGVQRGIRQALEFISDPQKSAVRVEREIKQ